MSVLSDFPHVGDLFLGRYRIESILGSGGFARVYRATQTDLDRDVAIKVMRPAVEKEDSTEETIAQIELVEQRFRREAKVISKFRSPNTVVVHDYGRTEGGLLYMTLEFVDGDTLSRIIRRDAPLEPARAVHLVRQVLDSLYEAHAFDVLHRDIKPQNLMVFSHLDQHDLVKVLDFGIAKVLEVEEEAAAVQELTTDGTLIGTPRYMSPEQIRGDRLTPASDLYSLGLVLYEALTGVKAVSEKTTMRIIAVHLDPRPIEFPADKPIGPGMRRILERMLAKEPGDRFQSAKEVLAAFDDWDADEERVLPEAPPASVAPPVPRAPRDRVRTPTIGATLAPQLDSEAEYAPTLLVDPSIEIEDDSPDEDVLQTQPLTAEEIEEAARADRPSAEVDVSDPPVPLHTEVDDDDTHNGPIVLPSRTMPIFVALGVVLLLGVIAVVGLSGDDRAEAAADPGDGGPSEVADPAEPEEHAELRDPPAEAEQADEPEFDEAPDAGAQLELAPKPEAATAKVAERESSDDGADKKPEEPKVEEDEPADAKPRPRPPRKPPKTRNKLWSVE